MDEIDFDETGPDLFNEAQLDTPEKMLMMSL